MNPKIAVHSVIPSAFRMWGREGRSRRLSGAGIFFAAIFALCLMSGGAWAQDIRPVELTPEELAWRSEHPVVNVGVFAGDHLPAETWVAGHPEGFGVDYASLLAGHVGLRLEFHPYADWEAVAYADPARPAPYDLLLGQLSTEEGRARFDFLHPYEAGRLMLVARKGNLQVRSEQDLDHARIAIERSFHAIVTMLSARFPRATLVFADDGRQAMDMVAVGQADAYIGTTASRTQALLSQRKTGDLRMLSPLDTPPIDMALAVPRDRTMLLRLLRKAEATVTPEELARLRSRWGLLDNVGAPPPLAAGLSKQERAWLGTLQPLRLGFEVDRHPYTFIDSEGRFDGLAADYVEILQHELGLRVQFVPAEDLSSLQRMVRAREVDMVAATMPGDFSAQDMILSRPYEHFPEVIVARLHGPPIAGPEDLAGHSVAVREEAGLLPRLKMLLPRSNLLTVGSNEAGLQLVATHKVDAYIGTLPAIDPLIRDRYAATLRVVGPAGVDQDFTIGINSEYAKLMPLIDRVLSNVTEAKSQSIRRRWLTAEYRYGVPLSWVLAGLLISVLVLGFIGFAYSRLRLLMRARTIAERELAAQLAFQQALLETIPYPVFVKDAEGRYIAINRAYEAMFECSRADLIGHMLARTRHVKGMDADAMHQADLDVLSSGDTIRRELRLTTTNSSGQSRDVLLWLHPFTRGPGEPPCLLGALVDVSDIREAEARARASEQRLVDTNDRLPGAILRLHVDADGGRTYDHVTGQTEALFGMTHQQILEGASRPIDAALPEDQPKVLEAIGQVVDSGAAGSVEFRTLVNDRIRWIRASGGTPRAERDGGLSWSVYCDDVTVEKEQARALVEAEARARASEERLIDTNDSLPGVILRTYIDRDGRRTYDHVSGQTAALFGMTHQQILSGAAFPLDAALPEDRPLVLEVIRKMIDNRAAGISEFRTLVNGRIRWIRASGGTPRAESNDSLSWSVYCDDVTIEKEQARALAEAKATAEAAVASKNVFLAMMSHEIRTPMAGVLGLVELMAQTPLDREQQHMLGMVQDSAGALLQILDDVLDFSRIESGRLELEEHPFDLRALADGVVGLFAARAHEKGVRLYSPLDWRLAGEYTGDAVRIRQVITNLLSNALKFTEKGYVELRVELLGEESGGQRLRISVIDTGIGISHEQLGRLFQPFTQAEASTTRRFGGTGLGLTICHRLATLMGGEVRLTSAPGQGTQATFEFTLPVARALKSHTAITGKTVLLCTHDAMLERELSNTLSALGLNLVEADAEDLRDFEANDVDLFVVDTDIVKAGLVPAGARCIRLVDSPDPRGFAVEEGSVVLCGNPLLWRSAVDACHAALGLALPGATGSLPVASVRQDARILVAEDHPISRAVISRQLVRLGYAHTVVENGERALAAMVEANYDLLITDCHMPMLDGYALTQRIRVAELAGETHLPIIALSASALPEQVQRCQDAGMDDFLAKPIQLDELQAKLAVYLHPASNQQTLPASSHARPPGSQLSHLMDLFGSAKKVREVLRGLLDTGRQDMAELDRALQTGDVQKQRDLLHRIDGSLCMIGDGGEGADTTRNDVVQQRNAQLYRLDALEALLREMEEGA
jgi:PAS domain S-box-containing protein